MPKTEAGIADDTLADEKSTSMYHSHRDRCPIECVVPPHILSAIGQNGSPIQRKRAIETLDVTDSFKSKRIASAERKRRTRATRREQGRLFGRVRRLVEAVPERIIYSADNKYKLPGNVERVENAPQTGDATVDEAYDGLGATWNLFFKEYERNSINDMGMALRATAHYGQSYDNAFWDGSQMIFGDGDVPPGGAPGPDDLFQRFTIAIDVTAHELTHGVTEHEAGLIYWDQPGALNESISDVFASLVKQYKFQEKAADADWLIGEGLLVPSAAPGVNRTALRSLKAPGTAYDDPAVLGKDPQPADMDHYVRTHSDNRGVHINSGIPNHAFYLAAIAIGGYAWEKAGLIWYETLRSPFLRPTTNFQGFAHLTVMTAQQLFGVNSLEAKAVRNCDKITWSIIFWVIWCNSTPHGTYLSLCLSRPTLRQLF